MDKIEALCAAIDEASRVSEAAEALLDEALASVETSKQLADDFHVRWARKMLRSAVERQKIVRDYRLALMKRDQAKAGKDA